MEMDAQSNTVELRALASGRILGVSPEMTATTAMGKKMSAALSFGKLLRTYGQDGEGGGDCWRGDFLCVPCGDLLTVQV